jgi:hypothetical protein
LKGKCNLLPQSGFCCAPPPEKLVPRTPDTADLLSSVSRARRLSAAPGGGKDTLSADTMHEPLKRYAFALLALRALIDLTLAVMIYRQSSSLVPGVGLMLICSVFYLFLYFGIRNEEFPGRHGRRVILWREPAGYWLVLLFLVVSHLSITLLMFKSVHW